MDRAGAQGQAGVAGVDQPRRRVVVLAAALLSVALAITLVLSAAAGSAAGAPAPKAKPAKGGGGSLFGVVLQGELTAAQQARLIELQPASVRFLLLWDFVQLSPGQCLPTNAGACNWNSIDPQVGAAAAAGADPFPFLYGGPSVLGLNTYKPPLGKQAQALWKAFLRAAVLRYGPNGTYWDGPFQSQFPGAKPNPVTEWQIWNEPGSPTYFRPKPNARKFVKLMRISQAAIRGANKKAKIVTAGLFSGGNRPRARGRIPAAPFLKRVYNVPGAENTFDAVALHPYASKVSGVMAQARALRRVMSAANDKGAKLWITEVGWSSNVNKKSLIAKGTKGQARTLRSAFNALLSERGPLGLQAVQWFSLEDVPKERSSCQNCPFTGLIRTDASTKPSFAAFKSFTR